MKVKNGVRRGSIISKKKTSFEDVPLQIFAKVGLDYESVVCSEFEAKLREEIQKCQNGFQGRRKKRK
jgi:hypothetical protein